MYVCPCIHTYIHTYIIHSYIHTYIVHTYIHTYIQTNIHAYKQAHTHTQTYTHIYKYTYTHMQVGQVRLEMVIPVYPTWGTVTRRRIDTPP